MFAISHVYSNGYANTGLDIIVEEPALLHGKSQIRKRLLFTDSGFVSMDQVVASLPEGAHACRLGLYNE